MSEYDDFDQMADEAADKTDISRTPRPVARPSSYQFQEEEEPPLKQRSCCRCSLPLLLIVLLFALVLGLAGIAGFNLYRNLTNHIRLAEVEIEAQQQSNTVIEVFNGTNNHEVEVALNILRQNVTAEFNRISSDLNALKTNASGNFAQIQANIDSFVNDVANRFSDIENSTLAKSELLGVETKLSDLEGRVDEIDNVLSSGVILISKYSLVVGLVTVLCVYL